ncbi:MAG: adenylate kinase [Verrucomicrobiales bacterium]|nr:adenylate kinase [Verrucomicrobiales bacterium]|tara:strand:- start:463 stop:1047 length:585 start_codon:yes stop_codon:yes gene_type:complete
MKYKTILLFGAPGSGKGTQGRVLGRVPNYFYFSCGDVFRNLRPEDPLGRKFMEFSSRGELVPDELTVELWQKHLDACTRDGEFHPEHDWLVLDGIPRNTSQVDIMNDSISVHAVLHLACNDMSKMEERIQRRALKENRLDDGNVETIRHRFKTYIEETQPVLDKYRSEIVHDIDSTDTPLNVFANVVKIVQSLN